MPGTINNKNAEKWTLQEARKMAEQAYNTINDDCYFLSDVAEQIGTYRQLFEYLLNKYNDDDIVFTTIKRLYNKCESIVVKHTANGKINPALGIFVLKAYHGLFETSKQHTDITTQGKKITDAREAEERVLRAMTILQDRKKDFS